MFSSRRAGDKYVDRGVVAAVDFAVGDFTKDSAWHTLDLSSIIPSNAKKVTVVTRWQDVTAIRSLQFSTTSGASGQNVFSPWSENPLAIQGLKFELVPTSAGLISYWIQSGTWTTFNLTVVGWTI